MRSSGRRRQHKGETFHSGHLNCLLVVGTKSNASGRAPQNPVLVGPRAQGSSPTLSLLAHTLNPAPRSPSGMPWLWGIGCQPENGFLVAVQEGPESGPRWAALSLRRVCFLPQCLIFSPPASRIFGTASWSCRVTGVVSSGGHPIHKVHPDFFWEVHGRGVEIEPTVWWLSFWPDDLFLQPSGLARSRQSCLRSNTIYIGWSGCKSSQKSKHIRQLHRFISTFL